MLFHVTPSVGCLGVANRFGTDESYINYDRVLRKDTVNGGNDPDVHATTARTSQTCAGMLYDVRLGPGAPVNQVPSGVLTMTDAMRRTRPCPRCVAHRPQIYISGR